MQISITPPLTREQTADYYELGDITDRASEKTVVAEVTTVFGAIQLVLWEGEGYDQIGNWTEAQARAKISSLLQQRYA